MNDLTGKKVFVTGGAGMIGSHITNLLVKEGASEVVVYDNFTRGSRNNLVWARENGNVKIVLGDIRDKIALREYMEGSDYLFHLAARRLTRCAKKPREAFEVLFEGSYNVFEAAADLYIKKVVYSSSSSIYGMATTFPINEEHHPYNNTLIYGAGKMAGEMILRSFYNMFDLDYVAFRYFNVFGPHMDIYGAYTEVMVRWLDRIAKGEAPIIFGDGNQTMDLTYVEDVARANILAMQSIVTDEVFNIATGKETSLLELANMMLELCGLDIEPIFKPVERVNVVERRVADVEKAKRLLDFESTTNVRDGLKALIEWRKNQ